MSTRRSLQNYRSTSCLQNTGNSYSFVGDKIHFSLTKKCQSNVQYPFKPQIHEMPGDIYKKTTKTQCSRQEIIERLLENRKIKQEELLKQRVKNQQIQTYKNCTFQPMLNQYSKRIAMQQKSVQENVHNRLYELGLEKNREKDIISLTMIQDKQNYCFQPQVKPNLILNAEKTDLRPIYERLQNIIQQKRQYAKNLKQKYQSEELRPIKTNERSQRIIANKQEFKMNIMERVKIYIERKKQKEQQLIQKQQSKISMECPFRPNIGPCSKSYQDTSFIQRQKQYAEQFKQRLQMKINQIIRQKFQPEINKISNLLIQPERENQTQQEKLQRMIMKPLVERQQAIQKIEEEAYKECTFQPQINIISKILNANPICHHCNSAPKQQEYDFQPKINPKSKSIAEKCKDTSKMWHSRKDIREKYKMQKQYQQLKQCTFKPKINNKVSKDRKNQLSNINGFQSFHRKIQRARKIKQQQQEAQEKLFQLQKRYQPRKKTEVQEFKLSKGYNHHEFLKQEDYKRFNQVCTFQPKIN